ncbi:probable peptide chain release factor C12orf65, mitochondrial [Nephila pilipes]|uniref:Probable peptide chain release factor C12orf65, mitochondrial n=1 Tax=Nephila pilipes TaxID=299642 RepID=A0A8X6MPG3_NEPPI|nr:probable peptide chain release factor C12orf65, mitochondrial [Nephila pilipes]
MAPGPKKKNFQRRGGEILQDLKKVSKPNLESQNEKLFSESTNLSEISMDTYGIQDKKYSKRSVTSNWTKYDEPVSDPHADSMRGKDFEVLLSYSGGSQLQLQDEKEWDEVCVSEKAIALDFQDLASVLKCIPFHKRINLTEDVFNNRQLEKFTSYAGIWKSSYESQAQPPVSSDQKEVVEKSEIINSSFNIIESYESDNVTEVVTKQFVLEEKTENIIESLASCLSLKSPIPIKVSDSQIKTVENTTDDLDFLLTLSKSNNTKQEKVSTQKQTNVDDWLNNLKMTITRLNVIQLYKDILKYSKTLKLTDKDYFLQQVKKEFKGNKHLTSSEDISYHFKRGKNFLKNKRPSISMLLKFYKQKSTVDYSKFPKLEEKDVEEQFIKGSGPGGSNVNKSVNCVLLKHKPTGIIVKCHESRLLQENQKIARERLLYQLDEYYNGEMSITAQKKRIEKMKQSSQKAKRQKLRELKQNFLNSNSVNKS